MFSIAAYYSRRLRRALSPASETLRHHDQRPVRAALLEGARELGNAFSDFPFVEGCEAQQQAVHVVT
jgi:hypothetical protein